MLTAPVQPPLKKQTPKAGFQRKSDGRRVGPAALDDSLFLSGGEVAEYPVALQPLAAQFARVKEEEPINRDWPTWEKRLLACENDLALVQFLEKQVFAVLERRTTAEGDKGQVSFESVAENYPRILQRGMNILRVDFRNPLAAHTLFQRAKTLSAESYVLGCTTGAYNEWMLVRWDGFRDLTGVVDMLEEMGMNGVRGDEKTVRIVETVVRDVQEWSSLGPEAIRPFWGAEGERVGRLEKILREIRGELGIREERGGSPLEMDGREIDPVEGRMRE
jgi:Mtf2 family